MSAQAAGHRAAAPHRRDRPRLRRHARSAAVVEDRVLARRLAGGQDGLGHDACVWNPWSTKAAGIADLEPDDWRRMVCVETANAADDAVTLGARRSATS